MTTGMKDGIIRFHDCFFDFSYPEMVSISPFAEITKDLLRITCGDYIGNAAIMLGSEFIICGESINVHTST